MAKGYLQYECELSGDSLIMHNGQTADPLNSFSKAMKEISGKRKKTDADFEALANIEYQAGLYLNAKGQVIIPSRVLESVLVEGAKKSKEGKLALSGMFVDTDAILARRRTLFRNGRRGWHRWFRANRRRHRPEAHPQENNPSRHCWWAGDQVFVHPRKPTP
jgi:hypothetical protein